MTAPVVLRPGRSRLRNWVGGPFLVLLVTGLVGFLLVSQLRGTERFRQRLENESEADLTRILASLTTEADSLQDEIASLRLQLLTLETSSERDETAAQTAEQQLRSLEVLSGAVPVAGPGVTVFVDDPRKAVGYDSLIDIVQELRDAGAEAVGVNDLRVGVASAFAERDGRIALDGVLLESPYTIEAIGQASTLDGGLKIPGGAVDALRALRGVEVRVERATALEIAALSRPPSFRVARPVGSGS